MALYAGSSSESSSSDSQPGTGTTSQSDLTVDLPGSSHDGGTSSTGEPAALFANGLTWFIRDLFSSRNFWANRVGENPMYTEEPDPDEVIILSSGQSENFVGADCSVDLKDGVACSRQRCLSVCIPISLLLVFCAGVALLVTFLAVPGFQRHFLTEGTSTHCRLFWL